MMLAILNQILFQNQFLPDTENERENKVRYGSLAFQVTTQIDAQTFETAKLILSNWTAPWKLYIAMILQIML